MVEVWKPVKGYEELYEVSDMGNVKALRRTVNSGKCHRTWEEHFIKFAVDGSGYFRTNLAKDGVNKTVKVHRLVAEAFIPNPLNLPEVNHIDGNKQNNCVENLEWCSHSENLKHAVKTGLKRLDGEFNPSHKLTEDQIEFIRKSYIPRHPQFGTVALGKRFGVHRKTITRIINNQCWKGGDVSHVKG